MQEIDQIFSIRKILEKKWEYNGTNNINHDMRELDYTREDWKTLAQNRDVWRAYVLTAMNLRAR
ncbi:hypothetical protein C0J52_10122 [Blattella germanica]|nr:hypothetical protein C0J52_10122 [Blattella germanica]